MLVNMLTFSNCEQKENDNFYLFTEKAKKKRLTNILCDNNC